MDISRSYLGVHYGLRPGKQVERRILIDAFQLIAESGFGIREYLYIGMGSVHFIDFAMFHKFLGIRKMISVEYSKEIEKRVLFNVPYKDIIAKTGISIGKQLDILNYSDNHVIWLDYDNVLSDFMLEDLSMAVTNLSSGSLILITIDTEPPNKSESNKHNRKSNIQENLLLTKQYFENIAEQYLTANLDLEDFKYENLPQINRDIIYNLIRSVLNYSENEFFPLFYFEYADGHRMITLGGIVVNQKDKRKIKKSGVLHTNYVRTRYHDDPFLISIPVITRKEQLYIDSHMPCEDDWTPNEFELSTEAIHNYKAIYRFFPSYAELFL